MFNTPFGNDQLRLYNVLLVDSCPHNIQTYRQYLDQDTDHHYQISEALTLHDAVQLWRSHDFDVMVVAINLADGSSVDLFREINNNQLPVKLPVIILTPANNQALLLEAMKLGASDYFIRESIIADTFCRAVRNLAEQANMGKEILGLKKREEIVGRIALSIRKFLDLEKIYQAVVTEIQSFLQVDRVLIYKFQSDMNWQIMAEKVVHPWSSCLARNIIDQCFQTDLQSYYQKGGSSVISDVNTANLTECHRQLLKEFQVQANIVVPIIVPNYIQPEQNILWGLLIVHQCSHPRYWDQQDLPLLEKLSVQIGIALQQAELYANLQSLNNSLEQRVAERTQELENLLFEYQQAQEKLKFHSRILDEIHDAVFSLDVHGIIQTWNKAATKLYGYQPEEIIGRSFSDLCDTTNQLDQKLINRLLEKGELQLETIARSKYGQKIDVDVRLSLIKDKQGKVINLLGCSHNITDRKRAENALKSSELRFRQIFDSNVVGMVFADYAGNLIDTNDRFLRMLGYTREEFIKGNFTWQRIMTSEHMEVSLLAHNFLKTRGVINPCEYQYYRKDGSRLSVLVGAALLPETEYQAIYVIVDISDRKEIEIALEKLNQELEARVIARTAELQNSENFLQDVLQFAHITNWQLDPKTKRYTWSPEILNILRISPSDQPVTYQQLTAHFTPDSQKIRENLIHRLVTYGEAYVTHLQIIRGDGTIGHVLSKAVPHFNQWGEISLISGIMMDITEWQEAEENFRKSEQRFTTVANTIPVAIFCLNRYGECVYVNNFWSEITGHSGENSLGMVWWQALHPDDQNKIYKSWNISLRESSSYQTEGRTVKIDGSICWFYCQIVWEFDSAGNHIGYIGTLTDISDRKQAEIALKESQKFIEIVLETVPLPLFWKDRNSVFLGCNKLLAEFVGLPPQDIIGKTTLEIVPLKANALKHFQDDQEIMASGQAKLAVLETFTTRNGEIRWFESHKAPLRDAENNIIGIVGMSQDITERKQVADQLRATNAKLAKATRLKDEFLANMSHELRTPLNAILGMSEGLLEGAFNQITPIQTRSIRLIEKSGKHLLDLINDILDLSKIEAGKLTLDFNVVSISSLCHNSFDIVEQIAVSKNIQLSTQIVTDIQDIWVDERRMRQVLINLLSNAIKFTPSGGKVSLVVTATGGEILFSVTDTGIGIEEANLQNIFQPFVQIDSSLSRQHTGTGLGLALVEKIVNQHQGHLSVTSTLGKGSCFIVHLPCYPLSMVSYANNQPSQNTSITNNTISERSRLILLADDNEGNRQTMEDYLIHKGYQMLLAENGEEAITIAQTHRPDIILMDIQMPRLSGLEAISIIRANMAISNIPIIAITALALPGDEEKCLTAGANKYLTKPVRFKTLLETIEDLLLPRED